MLEVEARGYCKLLEEEAGVTGGQVAGGGYWRTGCWRWRLGLLEDSVVEVEAELLEDRLLEVEAGLLEDRLLEVEAGVTGGQVAGGGS